MTAVPVAPVEAALNDAERDVLAVVLYAGKIPDAARGLQPNDFADPRCRALWTAMLALDSRGQATDAAALSVELSRREDPQLRVGRQELLELADRPVIAPAVATYVDHVREAAERRRWRENGQRLLQANDLGDVDAARQLAATALQSLAGALEQQTTRQQRGQLLITDVAELARDLDAQSPRQFMFDPVWPSGDYGVLSAEPKAGKTWALADAAVSCASGTAWLGQFPNVSPGPVLMFLGEGGPRKMLRRLRAVVASKGPFAPDLRDLPIRISAAVPRLSDRDHIDQVAAELEQHPAHLVIVDPLYIAAAGAKGSDLYAMGEVLYAIQQVVQDAGASLQVAHHWNKGGRGAGHDRASGVGPGAWGRVLVSVAVEHARTEPDDADDRPGMTTVRQAWSFTGDEISDPGLTVIRRVWADDPHDLNSPMHYEIERTESRTTTSSGDGHSDVQGSHLTRAESRVLEILTEAPGGALTARQIGDRYADLHGNGLRRETLSRALTRLRDLTLADETGATGDRGAKYWTALLPERPVQPTIPDV